MKTKTLTKRAHQAHHIAGQNQSHEEGNRPVRARLKVGMKPVQVSYHTKTNRSNR